MVPREDWRPKRGEIPTEPGVYRFLDASGRVLYVGKAKNLRSRLSNYFQPLHSLHERTRRMVTTAQGVEWTVVGSELEALSLEYTWIKEFAPPFNVKFRDDKTYPYLAITLAERVPRVMITRNRKLTGARYFGPYTKVWAVRETVDLMLKAFPMRSCSDSVYQRAHRTGRPCLLGDIGRCAAPCVGRVTPEEHRGIALDFASFMAGNDESYVRGLRTAMTAAARDLDYESAARLRDQIGALETVLAKSAVVLDEQTDADVYGIAADELAAAVQLFIVRGGRIRGVRAWVVDTELDVTLTDLVDTVLQNAYDEGDAPAREIIVPAVPDDVAALQQVLTERRRAAGERGAVAVKTAQRGQKAALAETVATNATGALLQYKTRRSGDFTARSQALADIQEALGLAEAPLRLECFDVSHFGGSNPVASMVVFEDGLPRKDQYRTFAIADARDDTDAIHQVLRRRLTYLHDEAAATSPGDGPDGAAPARKAFHYRPGLLVIDGGQPQVAAAARALRDEGLTDIAVCGIAKRLEEIWLPDSDYPVILPRSSDALFLLQRLRDEAHRFALKYQTKKRSSDIRTVLESIPGLGPARTRELLQRFGSVARLRAATADELAAVPGIGPTTAEAVRRALRDGG
ncbi:excinuclease ABC subunit UvrC [Microcella frigidaquae]|uniref:UvrABC system protein C n=1 Tax=Microcella frigidaquae TaxID=424758 RepID=A0A840XDY5_9MICO|nr:excinuclease ABC subunit UvrC [Microcella frigidaquae]MBB5616722.1 excinuclease ABC subunit C [Microcella frigidaquae]NHN43836.1 excinuclease ABC subunit UvrC [Microcella frigidaquae]